jgi:iron complex transport system ATP-binding protein
LAGILAPSNGRVSLEGRPLAAIERRRLATRIAYVPQTQSSVFPFTVLEVVLTGRSPYTSRFRFENEHDRMIAMTALDIVGAGDLAARPVTELSVGETQLVAVARALAQEVDCLLLDEPSSSLDLQHRARLIGVLRRLSEERGLTSLLVTHDLQLLDPSFDYLFAMREGRLVGQGSPSQVLREEILTRIYDDAHVRVRRVDGRTFVWSDW